MHATRHCVIVPLLGVMLGSCAWQGGAPHDHMHELSDIAATIDADDARCRSSGLAPGSRDYLECRTKLANERQGKR
jgi:hypothetical protein